MKTYTENARIELSKIKDFIEHNLSLEYITNNTSVSDLIKFIENDCVSYLNYMDKIDDKMF